MKRLIEKIVFWGLVTAWHEPLAGGGEGDNRGGRTAALGVLDDGGLATLEHGHARVRRAEVDAYGLGHMEMLLLKSAV
jgi:hypothetical protein